MTDQRSAIALALQCLLLLITWICSTDSASLKLPDSEVKALDDVAKELEKHDWNSGGPCRNNVKDKGLQTNVTYANDLICICPGVELCHMFNISLKGQNLAGVLPKSLASLTKLKRIDLSRNYLTGTIPQEWTSMSLEYVSLMINRLSGEIPPYLGKMSTLTYLSLENNNYSGTVPGALGNMAKLQNLTLNTNYLTGTLPPGLKKLSNLIDFRISSNNFSGNIPDYFQSWPKLQRLEIQGSGFDGPIPSSISTLTELIYLRISDLGGKGSGFPDIQNMTQLKFLMFRSCKISGPIPPYLPSLKNLKKVDLSFNQLEGSIPVGFQNFVGLDHMFLTYNFLNGSIEPWISAMSDQTQIDLSYNNFDESSVLPTYCHDKLNLFRTTSRNLTSPTLTAQCEENGNPCAKKIYSLYINCGGKKIQVGKTTYEADEGGGGPASFTKTNIYHGFSSTGNFWDIDKTREAIYTANVDNSSALSGADVDLSTDARISPLSLTYYGRCLAKGNYTVTLYFTEISFRDDKTFYSLGSRIFDVYIQESLFLRDFDIVKAANGSEKVNITTFKNIPVADSGTIEVRFYYAGKGSTAVPLRGTYGPLISAISVISEFKPPDKNRIIKIAAASSASLILLLIIAGGFLWRQRQRNMPSREEVLLGIDLQTVLFTYPQIKAATYNFDPANKIGEGGFGSVYKGTLLDETHIAVKRLSSKSSQGNREFITEIGMISGLHHPNLVKLYGCCVEGSQLFLVYQYMVNNNLARALFDEDWPLRLDWPTRQKICIEIARGLVFLHEESTIRIVHRDIKPTNVLLDERLHAKISDFGLARLREEENTHISTRVAGTVGYMSPEYALWGYLTYKADVYSFGVVALEIVAGRSNMDFQPDEDNFCLLDWAVVQHRRGNLMGIIDAKLGTEYDKEEALRMIKIALFCTNASPALRPKMSQVVGMLEGNLSVEESAFDSNSYGWMAQLPARQREEMDPPEVISETRSLIHSSDAPSMGSSS